MANQPPNPPGFRPNAPQPGQGPGRVPSQVSDSAELKSALESLAKSAPAVREVSNLLKSVAEMVDKTEDSSEKVSKRIKDWSSELRHVVAFSDDIETSIKAISDYHHRMAKEGMKAKDYKEVAAILEEMEKHSKNLAEKGVLSRSHGKLLKEQLKEIQASLKSVKGKMGDAFDGKSVEQMMVKIVKLNKGTIELAKNLKNVKLPSFHNDLAGMEKSVSHLFGRSSDRMGKWQKYAQTGKDIKDARRLRDSGRTTEFNKKRSEIFNKLPTLNIQNKKYIRSDGSIDEEALRAERSRREEKIRSTVVKRASSTGMGSIASGVLSRAAMAKSSGVEPGMLTKAGMGLLARGEGSMTRGMASWGSGLIEGGAGGLAEMAGPAAPILIALEGLKAAFDKNQAMNSEVHEKLGGGGIYGGAGNPISSIRQVRNNLTPDTPFSRLNIGYDKNLALAQQMVEGGFSTRNLADTNLGHDEHGFTGGSFGTVQRNAYAYGKMAGLSPDKTMADTLKLLTQYKQSLSSTEDFFVRIARDTRAAGISTSKYIELIDEVNSHYDRSNKLLMTTVNTMKLLSQTGRDTAEDLKEAIDTTTNGGQRRDLPQAAYLNMEMMKDPESRKQILGMRRGAYDDSISNVAKAMGPGYSESSIRSGLEDKKTGGYAYLNNLRLESDNKYKDDPLAHQSANQSIDAAEKAYQKLQTLKGNLAKGSTAGGLGQAVSNITEGPDQISDSMDTMTALRKSLQFSHHNISDYMSNAGRSAINSDVKFQQGQQFFGLTPEKMARLPKLLEDMSGSMTKVLQDGLTAEERRNPQSESAQGKTAVYEQAFKDLTAHGIKLDSKDKVAAVQAYAKSNPRELNTLLPKLDSTFRTLFGNSDVMKAMNQKVTEDDKKSAVDKAESLAAGTRPTADIFADAFTWLFNTISGPLDAIASVLKFRFGDSIPKNSWASGTDKNTLEGYDTRQTTTKALAKARTEIDDLKSKRDEATDPTARAGIQAQIDAKATALNDVSKTLATFHNGGGVQQDKMTQALSMISKYGDSSSSSANPSDTASFFKDHAGDFSFDKKTHEAVISAAQYTQYQDKLDALSKSGQIKMNVANGGEGGAGDQYVITNNYNSVDLKQNASGLRGTGDAGEKPTAPTKVGN